jgi:hypothetical protein
MSNHRFLMRAFATIMGPALVSSSLVSAQDRLDTLPMIRVRLGEEMLDKPVSGFVGSNGLLYLVDRHEKRVIAIDATGKVTARYGREGEGPGEFTNPCCVGMIGDSVWVADPLARRVTVFAAKRPPRIVSLTATEDGRGMQPLGMLRDGSIVGVPARMSGSTDESAPIAYVVALVRADGGQARELIRSSYRSRVTRVRVGRAIVRFPSPFDDRPRLAIHPDGSVATILQDVDSVERSGAIQIVVHRLNVAAPLRYRLKVTPRKVMPSDVDHEVALNAHALSKEFGGEARAATAVRSALWVPRFHPTVRRALYGTDGTLWLGMSGEGTDERWTTDYGSPTPLRQWTQITLPEGESLVAVGRGIVWTWLSDVAGGGELRARRVVRGR